MKTLQELYTEIIGSDELKKAYLEAAKGGKVTEFLKAQGCQATPEEIKAFLQEKANGALSDAELESVAGGECNQRTGLEAFGSVLSAGIVCAIGAIISAVDGHVGQQKAGEGRVCNDNDPKK